MTRIIGITSDLHETRHRVGVAYANAVLKGGGTPIILPPLIGEELKYISICDGFVFSGGDDPNMEFQLTQVQRLSENSVKNLNSHCLKNYNHYQKYQCWAFASACNGWD
jgi:gamma-glutamyl-gamma-aminobutyrate hydrolase PuuD